MDYKIKDSGSYQHIKRSDEVELVCHQMEERQKVAQMVKTAEIIHVPRHTLKAATEKMMLKIKTRRHPGTTESLNSPLYSKGVNMS